ncbi:MAG: hypothetical protein AB7O96_09255 [Pseudobdellovibrionaceae bacterium]
MKILLTGFEPFGGEKINPSKKIVESLDAILKVLSPAKVEIKTLILPVVYEECFLPVQNELEKTQYDFVVHLGQAGNRTHVSLEKFAHNWSETNFADEKGTLKKGEEILKGAAASYSCSLNLPALRDQICAKEIPAQISLSPGAFICNHVYFKTLHRLNGTDQEGRGLFIHIPYMPSQVVAKAGVPSMSYQLIFDAVTEALQFIVNAGR